MWTHAAWADCIGLGLLLSLCLHWETSSRCFFRFCEVFYNLRSWERQRSAKSKCWEKHPRPAKSSLAAGFLIGWFFGTLVPLIVLQSWHPWHHHSTIELNGCVLMFRVQTTPWQLHFPFCRPLGLCWVLLQLDQKHVEIGSVWLNLSTNWWNDGAWRNHELVVIT